MWWAASCVVVYLAALAVVLWTRDFSFGYLVAAAGALLGAGFALVRGRAGAGVSVGSLRLQIAAVGVFALALVVGFVVSGRLDQLTTGWSELVREQRSQRSRELDASMALALARGQQAIEGGLKVARAGAGAVVGEGAGGMGAGGSREGDISAFDGLAEVRAQTGVEALAIIDGSGEAMAWAGDHHGPLPASVRTGAPGVSYQDRPLFSYLYFTVPIDTAGSRVVAAILLQTGLGPDQHGSLGLAERFGARTGIRPYFGPGAGGAESWSLVVAGDTIAHAQFEIPSQGEAWWAQGRSGRRVVLPLVGLALALSFLAWHRSRRTSGRATVVPLVGTLGLLALAPLGAALGTERLFSPALFLLPFPPELTLGRLVVLLLPLAALVAALRPVVQTGVRGRIALWAGSLAITLGYPAALELFLDGVSPGLPHSAAYWFVFQPTVLLVFTILAGLALPQSTPPQHQASGGRQRSTSGLKPLLIAGGLVVTLCLTGVVLLRWRVLQRSDPWIVALWAVPFILLALGVRSYAGRGGLLVRWLVAGWLAASAVLPSLWVFQVKARLQAAERGVVTLGLRPDPYLDYLLHQFAADLARRAARGEEDVSLLYRSWATSGLAREAYPARIGLWGEDGRQEAELVLGDPEAVDLGDSPSAQQLRRARDRALEIESPILEPALAVGSGSRLLAVPLDGDRGVTVYVPPRRSFDRPAALIPILGPEPNPELRLTLIPMLSGSEKKAPTGQWEPIEEGWRREALLLYPEGEYHAHLDVYLPSAVVILARGILMLALDLGLLTLIWIVGRAARGDPPRPVGGWRLLAESFRARVTVALFGFFLLPTLAFGVLSYRALAGEAGRTARYVAERAARQAASIHGEAPGGWHSLSTRIGEEVLYYRRGELVEASSPEAVELGVFGAWMPPAIYQSMRADEALTAVESRRLGQREYVVAYQRLPSGTLAVPVPVLGGETALRQRELMDLLLFAVLLGGSLSLTLSLAVGRALSRPIGQLRRASAVVGGGRLSVRLPESGAGEFGELFGSFNRMVRRLRRARAQELRAARILAWGEMSRQVAHEIKNPLTPIKLSVQHLRRAYADGRTDFGEILERNVDQILTEIDRLTEISRLFSRYGAPAIAAGPLEAVEIAPTVREALLLYRAGESGIEYEANFPPDLPPIEARAGELKEVLLNLLENAHTALEGRGRVEITARRLEEMVELVVQDDGPGVAPELLPRIFEPQFSTNSSGTGLGLAIVQRIVEDWGGKVSAESTPGMGLSITIRARIAERELLRVP